MSLLVHCFYLRDKKEHEEDPADAICLTKAPKFTSPLFNSFTSLHRFKMISTLISSFIKLT